MSKVSPCIQCGACCVTFRVSYYWGEEVPEEYFQETNQMFRSLKSTKDKEGRLRCNALTGEIGKEVSCKIYENRPSPCRDFSYSYENGIKEERCDRARVGVGLLPLEKSDVG